MLLISSKDNPNIKNAVKLKKSARYRRQSGSFIAEGLRVCVDAMLSGAQIETLFVTAKALEKHGDKIQRLADHSAKCFTLTPEVFELVSDTETPQGVLCVIKTLDKTLQFGKIENGGKYLALDNVQDPSNLGTILRSAEAFGVSGLILSSDCCDIYSPKVVRGSMGAVFRLPFMICNSIKEFIEENPQFDSYAAVVDSIADKITEISFCGSCVAVIGNEGNGIKEETLKACSHRFTIPMAGNAESLNASVAASIIIWEMIK